MSTDPEVTDLALQHGGWVGALGLLIWKVWDQMRVSARLDRIDSRLAHLEGRFLERDRSRRSEWSEDTE